MHPIKLTQYAKGGGCGCKISPEQLNTIVDGIPEDRFENLLVGRNGKDDAAVLTWQGDNCIISTTDFFLPIVDSPFDFGRIAAANALSDVYAMGGQPVMALALLGWPVDVLPLEAAAEVMKGATEICTKAGIPIAGGHSISTSEPLFGLSVTGMVKKEHLKRNNTCQPGDYLYITKPLGLGLLANAIKNGDLSNEGLNTLLSLATRLNTEGAELGLNTDITAMTDITGFGLLGHLSEMLTGRNGADIQLQQIPVIPEAMALATAFKYPNITTNNYNHVKHRCDGLTGLEFLWLCDPQTSGGLMFTSKSALNNSGYTLIGRINDTGRINIIH